MSTTKVKYMVGIKAAKEDLWLIGLVRELLFNKVEFCCIMIDRVPFTWQRTRCIMREPRKLM
jgi:hypothetical protein